MSRNNINSNNSTSPQRIAPRPVGNNARPIQQRPPNPQATGSPGPSNISQQPQTGSPQPPPPINYTDFRLVSSAKTSKQNVLKFTSNKPVHIKNFTRPVKLHRKDPKDPPPNAIASAAAAANSLQEMNPGIGGPDPGAMGGSQFGPKSGADTTLIAPLGGATRNKQMLFKKRTKQIFLAKEDTRKIKEQEQKPWVMEDYDGHNSWIGTLEGGQQAHYVLFVFSDNGFKVVPVSRWYNFQAKIGYNTLTLEQAEEQLKKQAKFPGNRWMMQKFSKVAAGEDGEESGVTGEPVKRKKFKVVDHGRSEGNVSDDDEETGKRKGRGSDIDADDLDFDDVWQDDEEVAAEVDLDDQEANALNARVKKEMKAMASGDEDEDDQADVTDPLTSGGKELKKLVRNLEKNQQYDESDEEKDPYASSQDNSDADAEASDEDKPGTEASQDPAKELLKRAQKQPGVTTAPVTNASAKKKEGSNKGLSARAAAKKLAPTPKKGNLSVKPSKVPGSPSPHSAVRAVSPQGSSSRSSSPAASSTGAVSPSSAADAKKRKRIAIGDGSAKEVSGGETKKMKLGLIPSPHPASPVSPSNAPSPSSSVRVASASPGSSSPNDPNLITEADVIDVLRRANRLSTKDFLSAFKKKLKKDDRNKERIAKVLKRVARHVEVGSDRLLELKPEFMNQDAA